MSVKKTESIPIVTSSNTNVPTGTGDGFDNDRTESWIKKYWRPAMAYQYLAVCLFDFIGFPLLAMLLNSPEQWQPLTLSANGFYHMAMGAILGIAAWTRGQEKVTRIENEFGEVMENREFSETKHTQIAPTRKGKG